MTAAFVKNRLFPVFDPYFKRYLPHIHGGWNNVQSVEKTRTLLLEIVYFSDDSSELSAERRSVYEQLKADVNRVIEDNFCDSDREIRLEVEYSKCSIECGELAKS